MSNMEFCYPNYLNTTTMVSITSLNLDSDTTVCTIRIEFASTKSFNRIVLENINWKSFKIYHSSNTANTFTLVDAPTTTSEWVTNSVTTMMLKFATVSASIITIDATATMIADQDKQISGLWFLDKAYEFTDMPNAKNYDPNIEQKNYKHEMSDGGSAIYFIQDIFKASIKRDYISSTERGLMYDLYSYHEPLVFIPFPTGTSWDGDIYEVNWVDKFEFNQFTHNVKSNGYSGTIRLEETAK